MQKYVFFKMLMMIFPNEPVVYVLGELYELDSGSVRLKRILWCDYPNWEKYYPKFKPFDIEKGWSYVELIEVEINNPEDIGEIEELAKRSIVFMNL